MSNPGDADATPITSVRQLADFIAVGCKPRVAWTIGTEHEKFGFYRDTMAPPPYEPAGIRAVLEGMSHDGWSPILDGANPIGLKNGAASVSLEPAGQLELSGGTLASLHETHAEMAAHYDHVRAAAAPLGLGFAPLGFHPLATRAEMPWMPKGRYAIMRGYMPKVGTLGLDMMTRTCTVQVNLDYASEADMRRKLQVSLALQPLATALFANSPFTEGRPNGFQSYRAHIWTDVDRGRSGMPACMFEPDFGFERYVEWLIDVPMYFVSRGGRYVDMTHCTFRQFMTGAVRDADAGEPTLGDFADHMTTVFTDVRLKRFLEMRGADAGSAAMMVAQSALWVGLLYDEGALDACVRLVASRPWQEYVAVRARVPRDGLYAAWVGGTLRDLACEVVAIARDGLRARAVRDSDGNDESLYLEPLLAIANGAPTQAQTWLSLNETVWKGDVRQVLFDSSL